MCLRPAHGTPPLHVADHTSTSTALWHAPPPHAMDWWPLRPYNGGIPLPHARWASVRLLHARSAYAAPQPGKSIHGRSVEHPCAAYPCPAFRQRDFSVR